MSVVDPMGGDPLTAIDAYLAATRATELADGRTLAYLDLGDESGKPLFFFHGLLGSRVEALALHQSAQERGYRLLAPDRPGFGRSDARTGQTLLDWPEDVVALACALDLATFGVIGISGGGPFALACAFAIPERLHFVIDVAGSAPLWTDSAARGKLNRVDRLFSTLGRYLPAPFLRLPFAYMAYRLRRIERGSQFVKLLGDAISPPDRRIAEKERNGRFLIRDARESFRQGTRAVAEETMLNYRPWGFQLSEIEVPVHLFHGTEDRLVPFSFGEYKASHLPRAVFNPLVGEGHFYLLVHAEELFHYLEEMGP